MNAEFREFARAKVNLTLHVTGRRADGYRLLDSLVVFPEIGDRVTVKAAEQLSLSLSGPFSKNLEAEADNLVLQAARVLAPGRGAAIELEKSVPIASGIGGGSADAAATLRALSAHWDVPLPADGGLALGADVPVCLLSSSCVMRGIGEDLRPADNLPAFWLVLVNRGVAVQTGPVFNALKSDDNPAMAPLPAGGTSFEGFCGWLRQQRNDMQEAACRIEPGISDVLAALSEQQGCQVARMSGSGGTCYGLFSTSAEAARACAAIQPRHPAWWVVAAPVRS